MCGECLVLSEAVTLLLLHSFVFESGTGTDPGEIPIRHGDKPADGEELEIIIFPVPAIKPSLPTSPVRYQTEELSPDRYHGLEKQHALVLYRAFGQTVTGIRD